MLTLKRPADTELYISQNMVVKYKRQGDIILGEIRSVMTQQPINFEYYTPWQEMCNVYYEMLEPLLYSEGTEEMVDKSYKALCKQCDTFTNKIKPGLDENTFNIISTDVDRLKILMLKLNYIVHAFGGYVR